MSLYKYRRGGFCNTIVTNKEARAHKVPIIEMIRDIQADQLTDVSKKISKRLRKLVEEVALAVAESMNTTVRKTLPNAHLLIDKFHVRKVAFEAVPRICINHRGLSFAEESSHISIIHNGTGYHYI